MTKINSFIEVDNAMNSNQDLLVTTSNNKLILSTDSSFTRNFFMAVLIGISLYAVPAIARKITKLDSETVLFAAPVTARKITKPETDNIFFPQHPLPASRDDIYKSMMALAGGRLVLKNGCLRLKEEKESFLLIWPGWSGFEVKNRTIKIKDVYAGLVPEVRIKLNSEVIVGGGGLPDDYVLDASTLVRPLPKGCTGPYWSVGSIELKSKVKK
jgi:hypothetical protein